MPACWRTISRSRAISRRRRKGARKPKNVANWILNDLQSALAAGGRAIADCPISPEALDELVNLIDDGKISGKQGKEVFAEMFASGKAASAIVKEKGHRASERHAARSRRCANRPSRPTRSRRRIQGRQTASLNFLKGQVMKLSQGKANPQLVGRNSGAEAEELTAEDAEIAEFLIFPLRPLCGKHPSCASWSRRTNSRAR